MGQGSAAEELIYVICGRKEINKGWTLRHGHKSCVKEWRTTKVVWL